MAETRKCPWCAEEIRAEALRCPYCRSRVAALEPERWYRDHPERRIAGVAAAISHAMAFPLALVRVAFVLLTFVHLIGPIAYVALWLIMPPAPGEPSLLEGALSTARDWIARLRGQPPHARSGGNDGRRSDDRAVSGGPLP